MNNKSGHIKAYLPVLLVLFLAIGILVGSRLSLFSARPGKLGDGRKIDEIMAYILDNYVDTVNKEAINTAAIKGLLESLDPHSDYITRESYHDVVDPIRGNFEGIGVQFRIVNDTIVVILPVPGGPSDKAGIRAGDRIVSVNDKDLGKKKITDEDVLKMLKGPKGSTVNVGVFRRGNAKILHYSLRRDVIPTYSIDVHYMINPNTGYIKLSRFAATTAREFETSLADLKSKGMTRLILDLRGNSGGYLEAATRLADEFLPDKKMIVYTEGRKRARDIYTATASGLFEKGDLYILIDESSASASEILAGAVQDNDRGTIVGRRSFGKGLVQEQLELTDGSALRLTVARYYTPTGRSIQKPYNKGLDEYNHEFLQRYNDGEMENPDSIRFADSLKFKTPKGKIVYGGGGIMPDVYIPIEKTDPVRKYYYRLANSPAIYQYAFDYTDKNRDALKRFKDFDDFNTNFRVTDEIISGFLQKAASDSVPQNTVLLPKVRPDLEILIKAFIARNLYDEAGFYPLYNRIDRTLTKTLELLKK